MYYLTNIKKIFLVIDDSSVKRLKGKKMSDPPVIEEGWIAIEGEKIHSTGVMKDFNEEGKTCIDCTDTFVFPAFCDSHTHLVYAGTRESEFVDRIRGLSYEEIAKRGGGILNSAKTLQEYPEEKLYEESAERMEEVMRFGTGAIEIKSGYGLTTEAEIKILRVARSLAENYPMMVRRTFLGAHAIPSEFTNDREGYIDLVINEMIPKVVGENLASHCDVFCDRGFFTPEESDRILEAATEHGLKPKLHANELGNTGGVQSGVRNNALSVDHLEHIGEKEIELLSKSDTIANLLPSTAFFLNLPYAPARELIDAGATVAISSDYNPGSTPSGKMSFVMSLAAIKMKMLPEEALVAATLHGAAAMDFSEMVGSITPGKLANFIITKPVSSLAFIPYAFGSDHIDQVILRGKNI